MNSGSKWYRASSSRRHSSRCSRRQAARARRTSRVMSGSALSIVGIGSRTWVPTVADGRSRTATTAMSILPLVLCSSPILPGSGPAQPVHPPIQHCFRFVELGPGPTRTREPSSRTAPRRLSVPQARALFPHLCFPASASGAGTARAGPGQAVSVGTGAEHPPRIPLAHTGASTVPIGQPSATPAPAAAFGLFPAPVPRSTGYKEQCRQLPDPLNRTSQARGPGRF